MPASAEQLSMIHTRYRLACDLAAGKEVLEVACGCGWGLSLLAEKAGTVTAGDFTQSLVTAANAHYQGRFPVSQMDAEALAFDAARFDLVLLFEALYYLPHPERFVSEAFRVLRPGGKVIISTVNREWSEFNPSPFSHRYHSADELRALLENAGFSVEMKAGFAASPAGTLRNAISLIRRVAVGLRLIPTTMKGKALLKRLFYGRLTILGPEVDTTAPLEPLHQISPGPITGFKVIYAVGTRAR